MIAMKKAERKQDISPVSWVYNTLIVSPAEWQTTPLKKKRCLGYGP